MDTLLHPSSHSCTFLLQGVTVESRTDNYADYAEKEDVVISPEDVVDDDDDDDDGEFQLKDEFEDDEITDSELRKGNDHF